MNGDMQEDGFLLYLYRLKSGAGEEYDLRHRSVWPELLEMLDLAGICDYQIWRHKEIVVCRLRALRGYSNAKAIMAANQVQKEWSASLMDLFESTTDADGEPLWLKEVFRFKY